MGEKKYIGIDIGGTNIAAALVTGAGEISCRKKVPTPKKTNDNELITLLESLVDEILAEGEIKGKKLKGIGIGVPGLVDPKSSKVTVAPNLAIAGIDLQGILQNKYKVKVCIGNDVNLGVLGEKYYGAAIGAKNVVGIFPGTGIGGGLIINNKLILGENGAAAELGHIIVDLNGPPCTCGNVGCIEAIAGRWAIERDIRAALSTGEKSIITDLTKGDTSTFKSKNISKALAEKDIVVSRIIANVAKQLGSLCVSLRHVFDPEMFVFGGGLIVACGDYILPTINETLAQDKLFQNLPPCKVVRASLGDDAIIAGAAALAMTQKKQKTKKSEAGLALKLTDKNEISINEKKYKNDVCINGYGEIIKLKKYIKVKNNEYAFNFKDLEHLSKNDVKLIILAERETAKYSLTTEDENWLAENQIKCVMLPIADAIDLYQKSEEKKSIVLPAL